jgi:hypothetical protein
MTRNPIADAVGSICMIGIWSLIPLTVYHTYLISVGQTTNENIRGVYEGTQSPFNYGCCQNLVLVCCGEVPKSRLEHINDSISEAEYLSSVIISTGPPRVTSVWNKSRTGSFERGSKTNKESMFAPALPQVPEMRTIGANEGSGGRGPNDVVSALVLNQGAPQPRQASASGGSSASTAALSSGSSRNSGIAADMV